MSNVIQQLKENEKPFLYMGDTKEERAALQATAWKIGYGTDFIDLEDDWGSHYNNEHKFQNHLTYRLRPDYQEPAKRVECEVKEIDGILWWHNEIGIAMNPIDELVTRADFIGFKYSHGHVSASPRVYQFKNKSGITVPAFNATHLPDDIEVLTPTHVIFREQS